MKEKETDKKWYMYDGPAANVGDKGQLHLVGGEYLYADKIGEMRRFYGVMPFDGHMRVFGEDEGAFYISEDYLIDARKLAGEVGGDHYKSAIEPWDFISANSLGFDEGCVVKYICRHKKKGGAEDIRKAISYCEHILKTQYGEGV